MAIEIDNFYNYVHSNNTENTILFKFLFYDYINLLPEKTCSSKAIYNILKEHTDIERNSNKKRVFKNTYNEYFINKLNKL